MNINYGTAHFLTSSIDAKCIHVKPNGIEFALTGYSNSGKSTLINCLTNQNKLSRFSKYPGRTEMINFFKINMNLRLVDLPGYGYSKKYKNKKKNYNLIFNYIKFRTCLKGILLLIDIRRLLRKDDIKILTLSKKKCINIIIILTKCDKLSFSNQKKQVDLLRKKVTFFYQDLRIILFSSFKCFGIFNIINVLDMWCNEYLCN